MSACTLEGVAFGASRLCGRVPATHTLGSSAHCAKRGPASRIAYACWMLRHGRVTGENKRVQQQAKAQPQPRPRSGGSNVHRGCRHSTARRDADVLTCSCTHVAAACRRWMNALTVALVAKFALLLPPALTSGRRRMTTSRWVAETAGSAMPALQRLLSRARTSLPLNCRLMT